MKKLLALLALLSFGALEFSAVVCAENEQDETPEQEQKEKDTKKRTRGLTPEKGKRSGKRMHKDATPKPDQESN
jgi:hypothetical protein